MVIATFSLSLAPSIIDHSIKVIMQWEYNRNGGSKLTLVVDFNLDGLMFSLTITMSDSSPLINMNILNLCVT